MHNVTRAAVPRLGDWCAIFVLPDPDAVVPDIDLAHADPKMITYARELGKRFPYDPSAPTGIPAVIRSGRSEFFPEIDDEVIEQSGATDEARDVVQSLALRSSIAVPLEKRGRILGAIQFVNVESSRRYTFDDLGLAQRRRGTHRIVARVHPLERAPTDDRDDAPGEPAARRSCPRSPASTSPCATGRPAKAPSSAATSTTCSRSTTTTGPW